MIALESLSQNESGGVVFTLGRHFRDAVFFAFGAAFAVSLLYSLNV